MSLRAASSERTRVVDFEIGMNGYRRHLLVLMGLSLLASALALAVILQLTGMRLAPEFARPVLIGVGLGGLACVCVKRQHHWRLTDTAILGSALTFGLLLCALIACMGLRVGFPVADAVLARSDALIGLDVAAATRFVAAQPAWPQVLHLMYNLSAPLCVLVVAWNVFTGDRIVAWRVVTTAIVAMQITAIVSIFLPARGATAFLGLYTLQDEGLPAGAGTYAVSAFEHFYHGDALLVRLADINGIVCFPSFHTVMALLILQGLTRSPIRLAAAGWAALTIVSTVPIGGHYVTDLAGGVLVWMASAWLAERFSRTAINRQWPTPTNLLSRPAQPA
jgi:membrane-associated phospholipid phosphatase